MLSYAYQGKTRRSHTVLYMYDRTSPACLLYNQTTYGKHLFGDKTPGQVPTHRPTFINCIRTYVQV